MIGLITAGQKTNQHHCLFSSDTTINAEVKVLCPYINYYCFAFYPDFSTLITFFHKEKSPTFASDLLCNKTETLAVPVWFLRSTSVWHVPVDLLLLLAVKGGVSDSDREVLVHWSGRPVGVSLDLS